MPRRAEPERVELEQNRFVADSAGVVLDESRQGNRVGTVEPEVGESLLALELVEVMAERLLGA